MSVPPNKITGANAGGLRQLPIRTRRAARVAQFRRSAAAHVMHTLTPLACTVRERVGFPLRTWRTWRAAFFPHAEDAKVAMFRRRVFVGGGHMRTHTTFMRCCEPGHRVPVAIHASCGPGR